MACSYLLINDGDRLLVNDGDLLIVNECVADDSARVLVSAPAAVRTLTRSTTPGGVDVSSPAANRSLQSRPAAAGVNVSAPATSQSLVRTTTAPSAQVSVPAANRSLTSSPAAAEVTVRVVAPSAITAPGSVVISVPAGSTYISPLPPPQNVSGTRATPFTSADLTWDSLDAADDYVIHYGIEYRGEATDTQVEAGTSATVSGLTASENYRFVIKGRNNSNEGLSSQEIYLGRENETVE